MSDKSPETEKLTNLLQTGLQSHDLSAAIEEVSNLRQTRSAADFQATLADASSALHKAGQLPNMEIVGLDHDALLVKDPNNKYSDLLQSGDIKAFGQQISLYSVESDSPKQFSYGPDTNTEYYNANVAANQTQVGLDATLAHGTGVSAEAQRQVGKFNVMYEHDLGGKGQDIWVSTGVGNGGNNVLEATVSNQSKPELVYLVSSSDQTNNLSISAGADGVKVNFRRRI